MNRSPPAMIDGMTPLEFSARTATLLPLPGGEGWGEGERKSRFIARNFSNRATALFTPRNWWFSPSSK